MPISIGAPRSVTFLISLVLAVLAFLAAYSGVNIPFVSAGNIMVTMVAAYVLLALGVVLNGF